MKRVIQGKMNNTAEEIVDRMVTKVNTAITKVICETRESTLKVDAHAQIQRYYEQKHEPILEQDGEAEIASFNGDFVCYLVQQAATHAARESVKQVENKMLGEAIMKLKPVIAKKSKSAYRFK